MTRATDILTDPVYASSSQKIKHLEMNSKISRIQIEPVLSLMEVEYRLDDNSSLIMVSRSKSITWRAA